MIDRQSKKIVKLEMEIDTLQCENEECNEQSEHLLIVSMLVNCH